MPAVASSQRSMCHVLSEVASEYGSVDLLRERHEVTTREYDRLRERADGGAVGGAGAWVRAPDGAYLLVRHADGWAEPGGPLRHGTDHAASARDAVRRQAGLSAEVMGLSHVHVRLAVDPLDRDPIVQPFVVFAARASGRPDAGREVQAAAWHEELPGELLYDALSELPLPDR